jgi:predicted ATPase
VPHLRAVSLKKPAAHYPPAFPFTVPAVQALGELRFEGPVTFFAGENGSGKSTLLEGIAAAVGSPTVGRDEVAVDDSLTAQRELGRALRLAWAARTHKGFFLRAEDFFNYAKRVARLRAEMLARAAEVEAEYDAQGRSAYAKGLAMGPTLGSARALEQRYGDLDARSHGQSFLALFESRFVPGGLYLLDEPEAALSPQSQLALIAMMADMVRRDAQFIVATHSPILLAYPGARTLSFDRTPVAEVAYEELEHVRLTREFLQDPGRYLRHLVEPADRDP